MLDIAAPAQLVVTQSKVRHFGFHRRYGRSKCKIYPHLMTPNYLEQSSRCIVNATSCRQAPSDRRMLLQRPNNECIPPYKHHQDACCSLPDYHRASIGSNPYLVSSPGDDVQPCSCSKRLFLPLILRIIRIHYGQISIEYQMRGQAIVPMCWIVRVPESSEFDELALDFSLLWTYGASVHVYTLSKPQERT